MITISKTKALAVTHEREFKHVKYAGKWKNYKIYQAYNDGGVAYIGLPQIILVNKKEEAR